jgi:seryl-tRNA synthetase
LTKKGFELFLAPALVRPDNLYGTGYLPHGQDDVYKTQDDLYLSATAEIPLTGYHANEILFEEQLPKKYLAFSPCFRREAGSYGKDTKGLYRLHEFYKLEQFILCRNDHQESVRWHEEITQNSESILRKLGLPYRVMSLCGGELGRAHVKTYDIEVWIPSEKRYRESHSSSYYHDFQTRRLNIRYRTRGGKVYFAHSLNNTAIATPRILIALLENNQQRDGSILIPEALQEYVGKERI